MWLWLGNDRPGDGDRKENRRWKSTRCSSGPDGNRKGGNGMGYHFMEILDHRLDFSRRSLFGFDNFTGHWKSPD
jgi:hypothetical protein